VARLLRLYGVPPEQQEEVLALLARAKPPSWLGPLRAYLPDQYSVLVDLELATALIQTFEIALIPGLWQTERYARAHALATLLDAGDEKIDAWVRARVRRQEAFFRREPQPQFRVIITELAIRYLVGGPDVMAEQLDWLLELSRRPNVILRLIPHGTDAHPSMPGSFVLFNPRDFPDDFPPTVYIETLVGDLLNSDADVVAQFQKRFDRLAGVALDPEASQELIAQVIRGIRER
jgi:hypothetical protein